MKTTRALAFLVALLLPVTSLAQFTFTTNNGALTITTHTGTSAAVVIPNTTNGYPIVSVGTNAFYDNTTVTNVVIGANVASLAQGAFELCSGLDGVTIPNSVTNIGRWAFYDCTRLSGVTIPTSVTGIGIAAFAGSGLTNVTLPVSVTTILLGGFADCTSLTAINATNNPAFSSVGGVLFNQNLSTLVQYPGGLRGSYAISNGVTDIGSDAFDGCPGLTSVTIPESVTTIEGTAFYACTGLTNVLFGNGVTSLGEAVFENCIALTSVTIPNSLTNITQGAFAGCTSLASVTIPNSVTSIGVDAFEGCTSLTNVTIPGSVTNVGDDAFYACSSLAGAFFTGPGPAPDAFAFNGDPTTVYYLPGTTNWSTSYGGVATALWNPSISISDGHFGVITNHFGFDITGTVNIPVVVDACTNLAGTNWTSVETCSLTNGLIRFSDPQWSNYPARFYHIGAP